MYSSLNAFPRSSFSPVSTPLCREVHKKLGKPRYRVRVLILIFAFLQIKIIGSALLLFIIDSLYLLVLPEVEKVVSLLV